VKILIPDFFYDNADFEKSLIRREDELLLFKESSDSEKISDDVLKEADAVISCGYLPMKSNFISRLKKCKAIVVAQIGYDHIDLEACAKLGIKVCNIPEYAINEVAEHTLALIFALKRGIVSYDTLLRKDMGRWYQMLTEPPLVGCVSGTKLGIIGLGNIGMATGLKAKALGMSVSYYSPSVRIGMNRALGFNEMSSLDEVLMDSDIVSIHVPGSEKTKNMLNAKNLSMMKKGSILINTSRGSVVDLDAAYKLLKANHIGGLGLDVLPDEPPKSSHPLIDAWLKRDPAIDNRVIITPHSASYSRDAFTYLRKRAVEISLSIKSEDSDNRVNWIR
jgi:lactate dehydrogenase-like 2-hydroxyacid dehydrogenase